MAGVTLDRCPGVLRPHQAADGAMVRIRVPGGQTTGTALARLGAVAVAYGSGMLQLTSRASLQVRGLPVDLPAEFERAVAEAGFLPSDTHERVRNIAVSPWTGLVGGRADLRPMVDELDRSLLAEPELAQLSGRFLFALDDGRGDLAALEPDLTYCAAGVADGHILVGDGRYGLAVTAADAIPTLIELAQRFQAARQETGVWRVVELPGWVTRLPGLIALPAAPDPEAPPLGAVGGHASVQVPLGFLAPAQRVAVTAAVGGGAVVITPGRRLILPGAAAGLPALTSTGLVTDARSPWTSISACVGAPWCAQGRVDTQTLVRSVASLPATWPRTHVSGCERRCGAPTRSHRDLVAPSRDELVAVAAPVAHA